jgi:ComF family protein
VDIVGTSLQFASDFCNGVLDLVYPPFCLVCKEPGDLYLCEDCRQEIVLIEPPYCRTCGAPCGPDEYLCADCREREYEFECARSAGIYDGALRQAIHALKYDFHAVMADPLAELMVRAFPNTYLARRVDVAVPIPIHHSRLLDRGFNQSEELARRFCKGVRLRLEPNALVKRRKTRHQVDLPQDERATNLEGAFAVAAPERIAGRRVLVIDDVFTTGATLNEAARVLRAAGAASVCAYTLARSI